MAYRIKNWKKFQHFKDRRPPWIKLYRDILDDADFFELSDGDAKTLILLWLIAGDDEDQKGLLPCAKKLAFRLRKKESEIKQSLNRLSHWLIQDDINVISEGYQLGSPETETETETETYKPEGEAETETETETESSQIASQLVAACSAVWSAYSNAYLDRYGTAPVRNAKVSSQVKQFCKRIPMEDAPHVAAFFLRNDHAFYITKGHAFGILLADAEKVRTEWATNRTVSASQARMKDSTQGRVNVWTKIINDERMKDENLQNGPQ
jgi:hypothetical protein